MSYSAQVVNPHLYRDFLQELSHFITRLDGYDEMFNLSAFHGVWTTVAVCESLRSEFGHSRPFLQELAWRLNDDVQDCIGHCVRERKHPESWSPWTHEGVAQWDAFLDHLIEARDAEDDGFTIIQALEGLRPGKFSSKPKAVAEQKIQQATAFIEEHLMRPMKSSPFWNQSGFARAYCIGLKDLWTSNDYKALVYILDKAERVKRADEVELQAPFAWAWGLRTLAGPHLKKFKGDSDAITELTDRVSEIRTLLPQFRQSCMQLEQVIRRDLDTVETLRMQVCAGAAALLVAATNFLLPLLVGSFGLLQVNNSNCTSPPH